MERIESKKWYIKKHEKLWQKIYDYYLKITNTIFYTIPNIADVKKELIEDKRVHSDCYLCEHAYKHLLICSECLASLNLYSNNCLGGLYNELICAIDNLEIEEVLKLCLKIKNICKSIHQRKKLC